MHNVIDENSPIGRYLRRVTDMLADRQRAASAQIDLIGNIAHDPRPGLNQLAGTLRFLATEAEHLAERAAELAKDYAPEGGDGG